ncbi:MAG TPA: DUF1775 domain-containing protein [Actinoplanes sp.]
MRHLEVARRAGVLAVAAVAGVLVAAGPAAADVAVNPTSAPQGSGANLTFRVTNSGSSPITRVKLMLPPDTPVAEVYPLSVDDWAPQITQQKLTHPLTTIHGGTPVTETAKDITWIAMPGRAIAPGGHADLGIALGPLPTVSRMSFEVRPTYADGAAGPAMPPAVLALTPAAAGQAPAHGHGSTGATGSDDAAFAAVVAQANRGPNWWSIAGWIAAGLLAIAMVGAYLRSRRRSVPAAVRAITDTGDEEPSATDHIDEEPSATDHIDDGTGTPHIDEETGTRRTADGTGTRRTADGPGTRRTADGPGTPHIADGPGTERPTGNAGKEPVAAGTRLRASSWRYRDPS